MRFFMQQLRRHVTQKGKEKISSELSKLLPWTASKNVLLERIISLFLVSVLPLQRLSSNCMKLEVQNLHICVLLLMRYRRLWKENNQKQKRMFPNCEKLEVLPRKYTKSFITHNVILLLTGSCSSFVLSLRWYDTQAVKFRCTVSNRSIGPGDFAALRYFIFAAFRLSVTALQWQETVHGPPAAWVSRRR